MAQWDRWNTTAPVHWRVRRSGPYTVVEVKGGREQGIGVAKKNPIDKENKSIGFQLALSRALRDYADQIERKLNK